MEKDQLYKVIAAVERLSQHPLAQAIVNYREKGIGINVEADNFQSVTGKGALC